MMPAMPTPAPASFPAVSSPQPGPRPPAASASPAALAFRRFRRNRLAVAGCVLLLALTLACFLSLP